MRKKFVGSGSLLLVGLVLVGCQSQEATKESSSSREFEASSHSVAQTSEEIVKTEVTSSSFELTATTFSTDLVNEEPAINLGTIFYQDLDETEPVQAAAKFLGCYIVDDGQTINFIPLMAATVQNLSVYTSGQGNDDYYEQFLAKAREVSALTGEKPVSIYTREGGEVLITAQNGTVIHSE